MYVCSKFNFISSSKNIHSDAKHVCFQCFIKSTHCSMYVILLSKLTFKFVLGWINNICGCHLCLQYEKGCSANFWETHSLLTLGLDRRIPQFNLKIYFITQIKWMKLKKKFSSSYFINQSLDNYIDVIHFSEEFETAPLVF